MISHVVLIQPRRSLSSEDRLAIAEQIAAATADCPGVRACRIGRRILHGLPGYEQAMREDYQYALILEFDDVQGLRDYLGHPSHVRLGDLFTSATSAALAYDYQMTDIRDADRLL